MDQHVPPGVHGRAPLVAFIDLLFIFILNVIVLAATQASQQKRHVTDVELVRPDEGATQAVEAPDSIAVELRKDGHVLVDGHSVEATRIEVPVGRPVVLYADGDVPYRFVMDVYGVLCARGCHRVSVATSGGGSR